jgi:mannobiose 2-epimerase
LDPDGGVRDDKKKVYGQAFVIYALAEYGRVFGDARACAQAIELYRLLETHARDAHNGGYFETFSRSWQPCADMRLSEMDMNEKKSMNNHLHVLEAYTHLLRAWPNPDLAARLREVLGLFLRHILDQNTCHFRHFFDEAWTPKSDRYTFGHDIEGSWLLCEAADVLGDPGLQAEVRTQAVRIARAVLAEGLDADGGLFYEGCGGQIIHPDKEWWPQAEAVVGFLNAWRLTGDYAFRAAAGRCWRFIQDRMVDRTHGEWFWRVDRDGAPDASMPKVSAWKCPYHNSRCCLEIIRLMATVPQPNP